MNINAIGINEYKRPEKKSLQILKNSQIMYFFTIVIIINNLLHAITKLDEVFLIIKIHAFF